jgi:hypothetical protein
LGRGNPPLNRSYLREQAAARRVIIWGIEHERNR